MYSDFRLWDEVKDASSSRAKECDRLAPNRNQNRSNKAFSMATMNLSIKRVPDRLVAQLRRRAAAHHRSLQGELLNVLEEAVSPKRRTVAEVRAELLRLGLKTADEARGIIREERDGR